MEREEKKVCQNCKLEFTIDASDFDFYKKIDVQPPTFCPECRFIRRHSWRNERSLFKTKCSATGKSIISSFNPKRNFVVYERDYWWSDNWDQLASGREYDFNKPFFEQFAELFKKAPLLNLFNTSCIDSEYGNCNANMKGCYMTFASFLTEDTHYSRGALECKSCMDLYEVGKSELSYEDIICTGLNKVHFSQDTDESVNSIFLMSCKNMIDSAFCVNMRNKSHCIFNKRYSKTEYVQEMKKYDTGSYKRLMEMKKEFDDFKLRFPRKFASIIKSVDSTGDNISNAKNCINCYDIFDDAEDCKDILHGQGIKDSRDCGPGVGGGAELMYECFDSGINSTYYKFNAHTHKCNYVTYTYGCVACMNLFGCVGLRNKEYCILNKQYSKEEYNDLVPKIIKHMNEVPCVDSKGIEYRFGEFFPTELSPFAYNETIAQEYYPLSKEQVQEKRYMWEDTITKDYEPTVKAQNLSDHIKDVKDDIINEIVSL